MGERVESIAKAQVWCGHRAYGGIPCVFCRQSDFQEQCRQALNGSQRGQGQGRLMAPSYPWDVRLYHL